MQKKYQKDQNQTVIYIQKQEEQQEKKQDQKEDIFQQIFIPNETPQKEQENPLESLARISQNIDQQNHYNKNPQTITKTHSQTQKTHKNHQQFTKINKNQKQNQKKMLCMDLFNFSHHFLINDMKQNSQWNFKQTEDYVKFFVSEMKKNYNLVCFLDFKRVSQETEKKWMKRRNAELKTETKDIPTFWGNILSEMFTKYGAKVYYCKSDCDITIASWAFHNNGIILSADQDFYRYYSEDKKYNFYAKNAQDPFTVYNRFRINRYTQKLELISNTNQFKIYDFSHNNIELVTPHGKDKRLSKLPLPDAPLEVYQGISVSLQDMKSINEQDNIRHFGVGSALNKRFGNPYYQLKDMRSALYHHLEVKVPVKEIMITWDKENQCPKWINYENIPTKNDSLLQNPLETVKEFLVDIPEDIELEEKDKLIKHNINLTIMALRYYTIYHKIHLIDQVYIQNIKTPHIKKQKTPEKKTETEQNTHEKIEQPKPARKKSESIKIQRSKNNSTVSTTNTNNRDSKPQQLQQQQQQQQLQQQKQQQQPKQQQQQQQQKQQQLQQQKQTFRKREKETLCMDLYNFSIHFQTQNTKNNKSWNFKSTEEYVKFFVQEIQRNYNLICFLDLNRTSEETQQKWKKRREKEVLSEQIKTPILWGEILAEMFLKHGAKVKFCKYDCDLTIASWAYHYNGIILSADQDYYRYYSEDNKYNFHDPKVYHPYKVCCNFRIIKKTQQIKLISYSHQFQIHNRSKQNIELITPQGKQKILGKLPLPDKKLEVYPGEYIQRQIIKNITEKDNIQYFDAGSALNKQYGNPHYLLKDMRAALYSHLKIIFPVQEITIIFSKEKQETQWIKYENKPQNNEKLLQNPLQTVEKLLVSVPEKADTKEREKIERHNTNLKILALQYHSTYKTQFLINQEFIQYVNTSNK